MNGVDFDRCNNVESGLLEPKGKAACAGKKIDSNGSHVLAFLFESVCEVSVSQFLSCCRSRFVRG